MKTIAIFFSPRTVAEVSDLKSAEYSHIWQRCGTLSLGKGSLRASCVLKSPVVAANLKFEYKDFYEKVGARTSNGLVCPRCTRIVNNSHGVRPNVCFLPTHIASCNMVCILLIIFSSYPSLNF